MINNVASGFNATCPWTRIATLLIDTTFIQHAICIDKAFRTAVWRSPNIIGQAGTNCYVIDFSTLGILPTRRRLTWINYWFFSYNFKSKFYIRSSKYECFVNLTFRNSSATIERISTETLFTITCGGMIDNVT